VPVRFHADSLSGTALTLRATAMFSDYNNRSDAVRACPSHTEARREMLGKWRGS